MTHDLLGVNNFCPERPLPVGIDLLHVSEDFLLVVIGSIGKSKDLQVLHLPTEKIRPQWSAVVQLPYPPDVILGRLLAQQRIQLLNLATYRCNITLM